jgi:itaconate CoA-transferase
MITMTMPQPASNRAQADDQLRGPLNGVVVVALEQAVSGPLCTRTLADLGARVIKIENPQGGDFTRAYDTAVRGLAAHFVWLNRGKESVTLDVRSQRGQSILHRLLDRADAFVSNLAPGATARIGVDADKLAERHPNVIGLEISGYGEGGPLSGKRAYDLLIQAEAGVCATTGWAGRPAKPGPPLADACTGLYGAITLLAALHDRARTRQGTSCSVSMFDVVTELMGYPLTYTRYTGIDQEPVGMGSPAVAPYGAYRTADGQTVVIGTTNDAEWQRLATAMGRSDLANDERFLRNPDRVVQRDELDEPLSQWCATRSLAEIQGIADRAGIGNARYNKPSEVNAHPHLRARDRWREVDSPVGPVIALVPPPIMAGHQPRMGSVPALGAHTDDVLGELGIGQTELADLRAVGVIGPRPTLGI